MQRTGRDVIKTPFISKMPVLLGDKLRTIVGSNPLRNAMSCENRLCMGDDSFTKGITEPTELNELGVVVNN